MILSAELEIISLHNVRNSVFLQVSTEVVVLNDDFRKTH